MRREVEPSARCRVLVDHPDLFLFFKVQPSRHECQSIELRSIDTAKVTPTTANPSLSRSQHQPDMSPTRPTTRQCWRRTDDHTQGTPKLKLVTEALPATLSPYEVLIKVHAVALNYRDANISHGGNPGPVTPNGIIGNDAAGEVIEAGEAVRRFMVGDRVAPNTDSENITGRETRRSWLAADEDGVLADYIVFDERKVAKLPTHLDWIEASILPCAGVTAWSALKGLSVGQTVLIQGKHRVDSFS